MQTPDIINDGYAMFEIVQVKYEPNEEDSDSHNMQTQLCYDDEKMDKKTRKQPIGKSPLTAAERMRLYRQRKKERAARDVNARPEPVSKEKSLKNAEKMRAYRQRLREKPKDPNKKPLSTSASRMRAFRQRKKLLMESSLKDDTSHCVFDNNKFFQINNAEKNKSPRIEKTQQRLGDRQSEGFYIEVQIKGEIHSDEA